MFKICDGYMSPRRVGYVEVQFFLSSFCQRIHSRFFACDDLIHIVTSGLRTAFSVARIEPDELYKSVAVI
uniref:Uncharacterized protein n=1 Tax=Caenorhabditis tropicalis TaxID=1561998 RepID=A0A1I7U3X5_9PELO